MVSKVKRRLKRKAKSLNAGKKPPPTDAHSESIMDKVMSKRPAKTGRGRRILKNREPKIVENCKTSLILRGAKGSLEVMTLLRDLHKLRTSRLSLLYARGHQEHPFETTEKVEYLCKKFDHTLWAIGSSSKKRPFRLVIGRIFNFTTLDMQEYNISNYKPMHTFYGESNKRDATFQGKPMVVFQGPGFDTDERLKRMRSLLLDFFKGETPAQIMLEGLEHVIVVSAGDGAKLDGKLDPTAVALANIAARKAAEAAAENKTPPTASTAITSAVKPNLAYGEQEQEPAPPVTFRRYHVEFQKSGSRLPRVELTEVGPTFTMNLDRAKVADRDRWKHATKVPRELKQKKTKSVTKDPELGKTKGQLHLGTQDFNTIHTVHHGKAKEKKLNAELKEQAEHLAKKQRNLEARDAKEADNKEASKKAAAKKQDAAP